VKDDEKMDRNMVIYVGKREGYELEKGKMKMKKSSWGGKKDVFWGGWSGGHWGGSKVKEVAVSMKYVRT